MCSSNLSAQKTYPPEALQSPCDGLIPGYYFKAPSYNYKPVLFSNMTLDEFVGYVVFDSIITHAVKNYPTAHDQEEFIENLTCNGDTLNFVIKYLYNLADKNPFLYHNFLVSYQAGKQQPMSILPKFLRQIEKQCGLIKHQLIKAEFILHTHLLKKEKHE